jgi:hypothetical protein
LFRIKWFCTMKPIDLNGYFNQKISKLILNFMMITNKSFNFVHVIYLQCIQSMTSFFLQIEECGSKFGLMFVFWAAQSLAVSCPGKHEQVWAMYVTSVRLLSPFPPPVAPRVFFVCPPSMSARFFAVVDAQSVLALFFLCAHNSTPFVVIYLRFLYF